MTNIAKPIIFESFNARALDFGQVAETFVAPPDFSEATKRAHTIILGPRGSGKTTILKMMHPEALSRWRSVEADEFRPKIDFSGVFVPADRTWKEQIEAVGGSLIESEFKNKVAFATFTTHVLRSLISTMHFRCHGNSEELCFPFRSININRELESSIVNQIASRWHLDIGVPSFLALKHALTGRLSEIWEFIDREKLKSSKYRGKRFSDEKYFALNFLSSAEFAVEIFDDAIGEPNGKWGLLFDELEIVPDPIRNDLLGKIRSSTNKFIFKLSMSPYDRAHLVPDESSAVAGDDYNQVALWYAHKEQGQDFCERLFRSVAKDYGMENIDAAEVLEGSAIEEESSSKAAGDSHYGKNSALQKVFKELADKDDSFAEFLARKGINLDEIESLSDAKRAATVRKIRSIVPFRNAFVRASEDEEIVQNRLKKLRSRKNPGLYAGPASLFAIVEGNPRWFIGIVGRLVEEYARSGSRITQAQQSSMVNKAINRFRAYLRTIPTGHSAKGKKMRGLLTTLDLVGNYFLHSMYREDFTMDPTLTFTVDSNVELVLERSLGRALNAGAIFYVNEPDGELILNRLRGKRFRISYLLATHYNLPLILGRSVSIGHILSKDKSEDQTSLFSDI